MTMNDKYISLANGPLKKIVKTLGLPAPVPLPTVPVTPCCTRCISRT